MKINRGQQAAAPDDWQGSVKSLSISDPPGSPSEGDRYIIPAGATGSWAGSDEKIAEWDGDEWIFTSPLEGWIAWVEDLDVLYVYEAIHPWGTWTEFGSGVSSHAELTDLDADDHTQYLKTDGTRQATGKMDIDAGTLTGGESGLVVRQDDETGWGVVVNNDSLDSLPIRGLRSRVESDGDATIECYTALPDPAAYRNLLLAPNGGNVGIGKDEPSELLDVNGTVKCNTVDASGNLSFANCNWDYELTSTRSSYTANTWYTVGGVISSLGSNGSEREGKTYIIQVEVNYDSTNYHEHVGSCVAGFCLWKAAGTGVGVGFYMDSNVINDYVMRVRGSAHNNSRYIQIKFPHTQSISSGGIVRIKMKAIF